MKEFYWRQDDQTENISDFVERAVNEHLKEKEGCESLKDSHSKNHDASERFIYNLKKSLSC